MSQANGPGPNLCKAATWFDGPNNLNMNLQYHIETSECVCDSPLPIGACLHCDLKEAQAQFNTLVHCLLEEATANGGHFASPDTDIMFRQTFLDDWGDGNKTTLEALQGLARSRATENACKP